MAHGLVEVFQTFVVHGLDGPGDGEDFLLIKAVRQSVQIALAAFHQRFRLGEVAGRQVQPHKLVFTYGNDVLLADGCGAGVVFRGLGGVGVIIVYKVYIRSHILSSAALQCQGR